MKKQKTSYRPKVGGDNKEYDSLLEHNTTIFTCESESDWPVLFQVMNSHTYEKAVYEYLEKTEVKAKGILTTLGFPFVQTELELEEITELTPVWFAYKILAEVKLTREALEGSDGFQCAYFASILQKSIGDMAIKSEDLNANIGAAMRKAGAEPRSHFDTNKKEWERIAVNREARNKTGKELPIAELVREVIRVTGTNAVSAISKHLSKWRKEQKNTSH